MMKIFPNFTRKLSHVCNLKPYKDTKWFMPNGNPIGVYIYNCVAEEKVPVILNDPTIATWYSCGPTVYDSAHIGHACCYVKLDIIQRILRSFFNIKLVTAMGVTDIDDKIIKKSRETETDPKTLAKKYEHEFWMDMSNLNVERPMIVTRVSDHMESISRFVKVLIDSRNAYIANDGSVYFDTSRFPAYGKLHVMQDSGEPSDEIKMNKMDFALWKCYKPGEPSWQTDWGEGRPGWHIECSAMISKIFGSQLDFHAGGIDLKFPHHENEEAQSCAFHNTRQWVNYWIHVGHLNLKETKMSKSLQNTISIQSVLEKYSSDSFRMACLISNYRYQMEYSDEVMTTAQEVLNKFKFFLKDAQIYANKKDTVVGDYNDELLYELQQVEENNLEALRNDFDTASCINSLLNLVSASNKIIKSTHSSFYPVPVVLVAEYVVQILTKFGIKFSESEKSGATDSFIDTLVEFRHTVRSSALDRKDKEMLSACDIVRDRLKLFKIQINDSKDKPSWVTIK